LVKEDKIQFSNLTVIRNRLNDREFRDLYRRAKVVTIPLQNCLHPGGITTLLEAFACGKAVVASNSSGIRDYLHHEQNCLIVSCGDAQGLKDAVMRLMGDDVLRTQLGRNARDYAERELSYAVRARRMAGAIDRLEQQRR
jgi:glycosyltransferase involved in cell wall biosynthesis